jgi:hypothetical protein
MRKSLCNTDMFSTYLLGLHSAARNFMLCRWCWDENAIEWTLFFVLFRYQITVYEPVDQYIWTRDVLKQLKRSCKRFELLSAPTKTKSGTGYMHPSKKVSRPATTKADFSRRSTTSISSVVSIRFSESRQKSQVCHPVLKRVVPMFNILVT